MCIIADATTAPQPAMIAMMMTWYQPSAHKQPIIGGTDRAAAVARWCSGAAERCPS